MAHNDRPVLSEREKQLLALAAQGLTDTAIANHLGISEATVNTYWGRVRIKLGPYSRTELVATAIREESELVVAALRAENERLSERLRRETGEYATEPSSNFYKDMLEHAADAIFIVTPTGVIESLNESAAELFGYTVEELQGQPVTALVPERFRMVHDIHRSHYLEEPAKRRMGEHQATLALHRSGREFQIAASLSAVGSDSVKAIICIVREVSKAFG